MDNLFVIKNLTVNYQNESSFGRKLSLTKALDCIDLNIEKGEILGLVGESGCGKSTLGKAVLNLISASDGEIKFKGRNITDFDKKEIHNFRKKAQLIFQNPYESLNPRMKIYDILKEPLIIHKCGSKSDMENKIYDVINLVGLEKDALSRYPHEFSGGQRQRIAIARALILEPEFIVADEPVSALDVSIQAQIINLLIDLKQKLNLTILFISHDLSVVKYLSDRIAVMYKGDIVEMGTNNEIFYETKHPYTKLLIDSIPSISGEAKQLSVIEKDVDADSFLACKFFNRCLDCSDSCKEKRPERKNISDTHFVKCIL